MNTEHDPFMQRCLDLATRGLGNVAPNPLVGAVIVIKGEIIGEGFHKKFGRPHAEINALKSVKDRSLLGRSTLYVNLEPCAHHGKTPPCTKAIIQAGIPKVVMGCADPNEKVAGTGIEQLRAAGIEVITDILKEKCVELNKRFYTFHQKKRPYIILKWAQTRDGFIAPPDQKRQWISGKEAQGLAHKWRGEESAIMIGTNTALHDDPELTVRHCDGKNPLRIVLDRTLRLPQTLKLFDGAVQTWVFNEQINKEESNLRYIKINFSESVTAQVLQHLYQTDILSLLVEGGSKLLQSFITEQLWDEARVFKSRKGFGAGLSAPKLATEPYKIEEVGEDRLVMFKKTPLA